MILQNHHIQYTHVIAALRNEISENDGHVFTGIFGTQFFFEVLAEHGLNELAYQALNKKTNPGFGFRNEQGATTTRERWNSRGSHNHPMFGGGLVWLYRKLAGMQADADDPGYKHIIFKPHPVEDLKFVKYFNKTPQGQAGIHWKNEDGKFLMDVEIPVGSTATVYFPVNKVDDVYEGNRRLKMYSG